MAWNNNRSRTHQQFSSPLFFGCGQEFEAHLLCQYRNVPFWKRLCIQCILSITKVFQNKEHCILPTNLQQYYLPNLVYMQSKLLFKSIDAFFCLIQLASNSFLIYCWLDYNWKNKEWDFWSNKMLRIQSSHCSKITSFVQKVNFLKVLMVCEFEFSRQKLNEFWEIQYFWRENSNA